MVPVIAINDIMPLFQSDLHGDVHKPGLASWVRSSESLSDH
jgi:hypothetical protein